MMVPTRKLLFFGACFRGVFPAAVDPTDGTCSAPGDCKRSTAGGDINGKYYWPHGKGPPQYFGQSPYSGTFSGPPCNLSASLKWSWHHPDGKYRTMVMGAPVIDDKRNLYLTIMHGIRKFSPDGNLLWSWDYPPAPHNYLMNTPALMDGRIFSSSTDGMVQAVDMESGQLVWNVKVAGMIEGDNGFIVARDGRVILDAERHVPEEGINNKVVCLNASDGSTLWDFWPDVGVWNFLPNFVVDGDDLDGTIVFQSWIGSVYRVNLTTGKQIWRSGPAPPLPHERQFTDGGHATGPNGMLYAVDARQPQPTRSGQRGGLYAYSVSDGQLVWKNDDLEAGLWTWPVVARLHEDGPLSVVTGVGALAGYPYKLIFYLRFWQRVFLGHGLIFGLMLGLLCWIWKRCKKDRKESIRRQLLKICGWAFFGVAFDIIVVYPGLIWYYTKNEFPYSIQSFDANTGQFQWRVDLPTWHWPSAAGDEEGLLTRMAYGMQVRPIALPCASSYPTVDAQGVVYFVHLDGNIYSVKDWNRDGVIDAKTELCSFHAGGSGFTGGPSIAPGMLAISTTDTMYVFGE